ncbi:MAG: asparagine synthase-related protein [Gemmatimonadales bacterium]
MKPFACVLDETGRGISDLSRRSFEATARQRGLSLHWRSFGRAAVLSASDEPNGAPMIVVQDNRMAVGVARVDNRPVLERQAGSDSACLSDLELILRVLNRCGDKSIEAVLGDFAFVAWDSSTLSAVAACDAMSIRKIYYTRRDGLLAFADRAETLAQGDRYDVQYLAERLSTAESDQEHTVYEGVRAVPAATLISFNAGSSVRHRYWSPEQIEPFPAPGLGAQEAATTLRELLLEAVKCRLGGPGETWSQLSGGLDSASVVGVAQWLAQTEAGDEGLSGTVTYVDLQGTPSDERSFAGLVVQRWGLRNEVILDPRIWTDEHFEVPRLDQPRGTFMHFPREYRLHEIVSRAGGRVLLTGQGPDEYLRGNMFFFADWIARGHPLAAVKEMVRRAAIGRVSFWQLAYLNAVVPLLPDAFRRWRGPEVTRLPPWLSRSVIQKFELHKRGFELRLYSGPLGGKYRTSLDKGVDALQRTIGHLVLDDHLDVRHPFLDRRLIEFGLRLPPDLVVQPYAGKWLLREAMRGLVPEEVRVRVGKGSMGQLYAWSFSRQRHLLEPLVENPILADLGVVDGKALKQAFLEIPQQPQRTDEPHTNLQHVLAMEAWLQIRAGRWPREPRQLSSESSRSHIREAR